VTWDPCSPAANASACSWRGRSIAVRRSFFLDEGTANLDPESERRVMDTLNRLSITRIVIAHREATISGADRIVAIRERRMF